MDLDLRLLVTEDLPRLHAWLNEPGVVRWWEGDDVSWDAVVRDYGPDTPDPVEHWIAEVAGEPVGWIQCYAAADDPEDDEVRHWWRLGVDRTAAGIDYLVGDPGRRGRGLGATMIRTFVDEVVFGRHPAWTQACASPYEDNVASVRALDKAGFTSVGTFTDELGTAVVMVRDR